ncbi:uncharacterized protein LOC106413739 isoform X2 [Brassica napus]|uniref:uncharacterized protein LOC106413739 isoform X2 n=1 Tax=Brassica napus TaxID=3708 RepID=UPI002078D93B|nr:uncharacterized protein LOC106413739 isoform X2 [Brassica napus]
MTSPTSSEYAEAKIDVFWDVKECPIPAGLDPGSIFRNIKSALAKQGYLGELTIRPYCDKDQFPDGPDDFESAGMKLVPPDEARRYITMSCELCSWLCREHDEFKNLMIISGDNMDFRPTLQMLKQRRPVNILLASP